MVALSWTMASARRFARAEAFIFRFMSRRVLLLYTTRFEEQEAPMMTDTDPPGARSETSAAPKLLVVGLGASAGGIQALRTFFSHVPADSGSAYVVILHLSPDHDSKLAEVLQTAPRSRSRKSPIRCASSRPCVRRAAEPAARHRRRHADACRR